MKPMRIQLSRKKGWRMPPNTVKVDRTTIWGNPFRIGIAINKALTARWGWKFKNPEFVCPDATTAVQCFRGCLAGDGASLYAVRKTLRGKNLACWCPLDRPCHADVLLEIANA